MEQHQKDAETIFHAALQLTQAEQRQAYLDMACAEDQALRQRVEALLVADTASAGFFKTAEKQGEGNASSIPHRSLESGWLSEGPGTVIDRYRLLEKIGEGGFGVVYMAEQRTPVKRRVALKIIKLGMDTKQVVARFEAERQALAMMDHPNIAKVLDAGATESGRPYFVMELVRGIPITRFCDESSLSTEARLRLFMAVCQAVHHAHQKGIIHRDLKPSNVMVTLHDDQPMVKVIDFGIAKATQHELTEKTHFTRFQEFIGTPAYMSPEQAQMSGLDIDTRSDIYSLGVLLYELLTGQTPFDEKELLGAGYDEIRRRIREVEPPRPSTRLSQLRQQDLTTVAQRRACQPDRLGGLIRGELDWMVMKALEKDRSRRYESASAFAQDVQRHLNHEPVAAAAPSAPYRFRKYARRNKGMLTALGAIACILILGMAISTWQAVRATRAERLARERLATAQEARQKAETARTDAETARTQAEEARREAEQGRLQMQVQNLNNLAVLHMNQRRHDQAKKALFDAIELQPAHWGSLEILEKLPDYFLLKHPLVADSQHDPAAWRYTFVPPPADWAAVAFDDSSWPTGLAGFGSGAPYLPRTVWQTHDIWLRREFELGQIPAEDWAFRVKNDDSAEIHLNGVLAAENKLWSMEEYRLVPCNREARSALKTGRNVLAVHCHNHLWDAFIDVGIYHASEPETKRKWVEDTITYLITANPQKTFIRAARAEYYARQGKLDLAKKDYLAVFELDPSDHYEWFKATPLFVTLGERDEYRRHCQQMLARFGATDSPWIAERIAKACLLEPQSQSELDAAYALAERAAAAQAQALAPYAKFALSLAKYRKQEYEHAIEGASQSLSHKPDPQNLYLKICSYAVLAMSHQQLGHVEKARLSLEESRALIQARLPTEPSADHGSYWHDWLYCKLLLGEAERLIEGKSAGTERGY